MDTPTTNLGLPQFEGTDDLAYPDVNGAFSKIDSLAIPTVCTSATRPTSDLFVGREIYETDTKRIRFWNGSAWIAYDAVNDTGFVSTGYVAQAGWTVNTGQGRARDGVCQAYINVTRSGATIAAVANGDIGNVDVCQISPDLPNPQMPVSGSVGASGYDIGFYMWTNGMISIGSILPGIALNSGTSFSASFTYLVP